MADYEEGAIVTNPDTGQTAQLTDGKWVIQDKPFAETGVTGVAKALGSGIVHRGVPDLVGAPAEIKGLMGSAAFWGGNKLREAVGKKPLEKPVDTGIVLQGLLAAGNAARGVVGKEPLSPEEGAKNIPSLPTSEGVRSQIEKVIPRHEPENFYERAADTTGALIPGAALAPEAGAPSMMAKALRSGVRYAAVPGVASEGVREIPGVKGSALEEPLAMAAMLGGSALTPKAVSPYAATPERLHTAETLSDRGATFTPGQLVGNDKSLRNEGKAADSWFSGTSTGSLNRENAGNYTRGVLRHFTDIPMPPADQAALHNATSVTPQVLERIDRAVDNEYNTMTGRYSIMGGHGTPLEARLNNALGTYTREAVKQPSNEPAEVLQQFKDRFDAAGGWLSGREYQSMRSQLSRDAVNAPTPELTRFYSQVRNDLDDQMEQVVRHFNPADAGRFTRARQATTDQMILHKSLLGQGAPAAEGVITPQRLGAAAQNVLGGERYLSQDNELARYARAGQNILDPLEHGGDLGLMHNLQLAPMLAATGLAGAGGVAVSHGNPMAILLAGAAPAATYVPRVAQGQLLRTETGRRALSNQLYPLSARPGVHNPTNPAMMAEALMEERRRQGLPAEQ